MADDSDWFDDAEDFYAVYGHFLDYTTITDEVKALKQRADEAEAFKKLAERTEPLLRSLVDDDGSTNMNLYAQIAHIDALLAGHGDSLNRDVRHSLLTIRQQLLEIRGLILRTLGGKT